MNIKLFLKRRLTLKILIVSFFIFNVSAFSFSRSFFESYQVKSDKVITEEIYLSLVERMVEEKHILSEQVFSDFPAQFISSIIMCDSVRNAWSEDKIREVEQYTAKTSLTLSNVYPRLRRWSFLDFGNKNISYEDLKSKIPMIAPFAKDLYIPVGLNRSCRLELKWSKENQKLLISWHHWQPGLGTNENEQFLETKTRLSKKLKETLISLVGSEIEMLKVKGK
jgi:hypothetical protein